MERRKSKVYRIQNKEVRRNIKKKHIYKERETVEKKERIKKKGTNTYN